MAKQQGKVYIGYEDDIIGEKNQSSLNYTINKIGGMPDWPPLEKIQFSSKCPLCGLHRPMITQCYAPLDKSVYHRTLYVFACINPNCWVQSDSWLCLRSQIQDNSTTQSSTVAMPKTESNLTWCNGADEWDENDNGDTANGNIMNVDNGPCPNNCIQRNSDEEEESNSLELDTVEQAFGNLQVFDAHNANMSPVQGAIGAISAPVAAAELEGGDDPGLVTVDTPLAPTNDLQTLLHQTAELPPDIRSRLTCGPLQFVPKYIYVEEEWKSLCNNEDKITDLLNKYNKENEMDVIGGGDRQAGGGGGGDDEQYEESAPLHGDRLFHAFLTRLRNNPGQILSGWSKALHKLNCHFTGILERNHHCWVLRYQALQAPPNYQQYRTSASDAAPNLFANCNWCQHLLKHYVFYQLTFHCLTCTSCQSSYSRAHKVAGSNQTLLSKKL